MEWQHEVGSFQKAIMTFVGLRTINMGKPVVEMRSAICRKQKAVARDEEFRVQRLAAGGVIRM